MGDEKFQKGWLSEVSGTTEVSLSWEPSTAMNRGDADVLELKKIVWG